MLIFRQHAFRQSFRHVLQERVKRSDRLAKVKSRLRRRQATGKVFDDGSPDTVPEASGEYVTGRYIGSTTTRMPHRTHTTDSNYSRRIKNSGLGGFPMPLEALQWLAQRLFPEKAKKLKRFATTLQEHPDSDKRFTRLPFAVGRNSQFKNLSREQKDELGGVEYQASRLLLIIVVCVSLSMFMADYCTLHPFLSYRLLFSLHTSPSERPTPTSFSLNIVL